MGAGQYIVPGPAGTGRDGSGAVYRAWAGRDGAGWERGSISCLGRPGRGGMGAGQYIVLGPAGTGGMEAGQYIVPGPAGTGRDGSGAVYRAGAGRDGAGWERGSISCRGRPGGMRTGEVGPGSLYSHNRTMTPGTIHACVRVIVKNN